MHNKIKNLFGSDFGNKIFITIENTISEHNMKEKIESGVLVGFSGGPDSMMLLAFLVEYRDRYNSFPIVLSHINHCIRGVEADRDEHFSIEIANALQVPILTKRIDIPQVAKENGIGIEEAARNARYCEFSDIILSRNDISCIAVAHNSSDNMETVIFNILRGSGTKGAAGISPVRDCIIRPLINVSKEDILRLLDEAEIPYVLDSSNDSTDYTRNFIRHKIMPLMREVVPSPENNVGRLCRNLRYDDQYFQNLAIDFIAGRNHIPTEELRGLHRSVLYRVLLKMLEPYSVSLSEKHIEAIESMLWDDNFRISLPRGLIFVSEYGMSFITQEDKREIDYFYNIEKGSNIISKYHSEIILSDSLVDKTFLNVHKNSIQADISSAIIVGRLFIRPKKDGDTVFYGGMTHKLKKLFNDRKVPNGLRPLIPMLCDDKGVVWAPGFGVRDDRANGAVNAPLYVTLIIEDSVKKDLRFHHGTEFR